MIGIYKITSPKGRVYIGQSIDIKRRFKTYQNINKSIRQPKLHRSLQKYGIHNHKFEIITECEESLLNELERYYQECYNCIDNGLNCILTTTETRSGKHSEETKKKMSVYHKGNKHWLGKKHSTETKKKMSDWQKGRKLTKEHRENLSKSKMGIVSVKGKECYMFGKSYELNPNSRLVLDLVTGIFYGSAKEASETFSINYGTMRAYLTNNRFNKTNLIYV